MTLEQSMLGVCLIAVAGYLVATIKYNREERDRIHKEHRDERENMMKAIEKMNDKSNEVIERVSRESLEAIKENTKGFASFTTLIENNLKK